MILAQGDLTNLRHFLNELFKNCVLLSDNHETCSSTEKLVL